jgi:hypothetical protein
VVAAAALGLPLREVLSKAAHLAEAITPT